MFEDLRRTMRGDSRTIGESPVSCRVGTHPSSPVSLFLEHSCIPTVTNRRRFTSRTSRLRVHSPTTSTGICTLRQMEQWARHQQHYQRQWQQHMVVNCGGRLH
ncbi:hypothetical protein TcWFU_000281 [Taenia crassiceps]|uniref:Uncharacterized protein n=1 Tax=Taenia crassiceps TaxID=6207 RepID=A0ABR4QC55_9CEST